MNHFKYKVTFIFVCANQSARDGKIIHNLIIGRNTCSPAKIFTGVARHPMAFFRSQLKAIQAGMRIGKGNKARQIAVSRAMLQALKHYRITYLEMTPYPTPGEKTPLVSHVKNDQKPVTHTRPIRRLVQTCFDEVAAHPEAKGEPHEAAILRVATVHGHIRRR